MCVWRRSEGEEPRLLQRLPHGGDVTALCYVDSDQCAVGSSEGRVCVYQHGEDSTLREACSWPDLHRLPSGATAACHGVASNGSAVACVGGDANIHVLSPGQRAPLATIASGTDSGSLCVAWRGAAELLTATQSGQLRLWDLRAPAQPRQSSVCAGQEWVGALAPHPTQQHVVAAGGEGGAVSLWDLRSPTRPTATIAGHDQPIVELRFHPDLPDQLFSCGLDGRLLHWHCNPGLKGDHTSTPWLAAGVARGEVETRAVLAVAPYSVDACDPCEDALLAVSGNEALYVVANLSLY